jgi:RND superfamily putative drug exporter
VAHVRLDVDNPVDMPIATASGDRHRRRRRPAGSTVALGGQSIQRAEQGEIGSEGIGLAAAIIILLLMFGSVIAAGLPVLVAVAGLAVSSTLTGLLINFVDAPDWSTSLATMMGIGIGIDYVLLMVTRFREWRAAGLDPEAATVATLDTAGRSVMVAGSTVVVSMLGLFAMGLSFMRGASLVTILGVVVVLAASVTLFPALLGYLGKHVDKLRLPLGRRAAITVAAGGHVEPGRGWLRWSGLVQRHRVVSALLGVAILLALAAPFLGVRFGFPDAGNNRETTTTRQAYDLVADGFGAGANGPLVLAVELPRAGDTAALDKLAAALPGVDGVPRQCPRSSTRTGPPRSSLSCPRPARRTPTPRTSSSGCATRCRRTIAGTGASVHIGRRHRDRDRQHRQHRPADPAAHRRRGAAVHAAAPGLLPQRRRRGQGGRDEPAVRRRLVRCGRAGPAGRLGRPAGRHRHRDAAAGLRAGADVRGPVRPVDGLRGVPGQPDAGGLDPHRRQRPARSPTAWLARPASSPPRPPS